MLLYIQKQALQVDTCGAFFDILGLMLLILALLILFNRTDLTYSFLSANLILIFDINSTAHETVITTHIMASIYSAPFIRS